MPNSMKIGKKLCSDFLYIFLTEYDLGITKHNVHAKFQENLPKNVEARLKKPTQKNRRKSAKKPCSDFRILLVNELNRGIHKRHLCTKIQENRMKNAAAIVRTHKYIHIYKYIRIKTYSAKVF